MSALFPRLSALLGFPPDTAYTVWEEVSSAASSVRRVVSSAGVPLFAAATALIFETASGALPPTDRAWASASPPADPDPSADPDAPPLPLFTAGVDTASVEQFLRGPVDAILARFESPSVPIARLQFPLSVSFSDFASLAARAAAADVGASDTALFYAADPSDPASPSPEFLDPDSPGELQYQFAARRRHSVFVRVVRGLSLADVRLRVDVAVDFSADAVRITRSTRLLAERTDAVADIRRRLVDAGFIPDAPALRFWAVRGRRSARVLADLEREVVRFGERLRIDLLQAPDDRPAVLAGFREEEASAGGFGQPFLTAVGAPFLFPVDVGETGEALRARLRAAVGGDDAEWRARVVIVAGEPAPLTCASGVEVAGKEAVGALIARGGYGIAETHLFIVERRKSARRGDGSVRIYN